MAHALLLAGFIKIGLFIIVGLILLLFVLIFLFYGNLWLQARFSGVPVSFVELIGMWLRKVNSRTIVVSRITAAKAGLDLSTAQLESHYLAGGRVPNVVRDRRRQSQYQSDLAGRHRD